MKKKLLRTQEFIVFFRWNYLDSPYYFHFIIELSFFISKMLILQHLSNNKFIFVGIE